MVHLGVELQAEKVTPVADGGHGRILSECQAGESGWQRLHPVAMAHPDLERRRQLVEQRRSTAGQTPACRRAVLVQGGVAKFLLGASRYRAAQLMHQRLHAVADAQHRQFSLKDPVGDQRGAILIDARGPTRKNDALGIDPLYFLPRVGRVGDLGINLQLPDAPGDQVAVLGTKVDDGDALVDLSACSGRFGVNTLGDFQVRGHLQVIAGGNPSSQRQLGRSRGGPP